MEDNEFMHIDKFKFISPSCTNVSGSSGSGKTEFCLKIIAARREMFTIPPIQVIYCFKVWQQRFQQFYDSDNNRKEIIFNEGLFDIKNLPADGKHRLMILDDLMGSISKETVSLFCVYSHHYNVSVLFLNQNFFEKSPHTRTMALNCQYIVLFRMKRDLTPVQILGKQLMPKKSADFVKVYNDITKDLYTYMLVDIHPATSNRIALRTKIFPNEIGEVYIPSSS